MKNKKFKIVFGLYGLFLISFALYSYSQIDLNLTLNANKFYQNFQNAMIHLGYFNRPLSTAIFLVLIFLSFIFYFLFFWLVKKNSLSQRQIYWLIGLTVGILLFSYPAFSHDIFNYIFDAKIVTFYHANPYQLRALDFPLDPWTRFMHWTHRYFPYGPLWLGISLIPSYLGLQKFTLTLLNFKILASLFYLGSAFLIFKILKKNSAKNCLLGIVFFALNPLVIIETLVSGHNEVLMLFFALLAIYLLIFKKNRLSVLALLGSGAIKFLTLVFLPFFLWFGFAKRKINLAIFPSIFLLALIPVIFQREIYPWYLVTFVGSAALVLENLLLFYLAIALTFGTLLRYTPFLYFGDYQSPIPQIQLWLTVLPVALVFIILVWRKFLTKS